MKFPRERERETRAKSKKNAKKCRENDTADSLQTHCIDHENIKTQYIVQSFTRLTTISFLILLILANGTTQQYEYASRQLLEQAGSCSLASIDNETGVNINHAVGHVKNQVSA